MSVTDIAVHQLILLWVLGGIGLLFSFILPKSKNRYKARASLYARGYIVLIVMTQSVLSAHLIDGATPILFAYPPLVLCTSYFALLTVIARFGERISSHTKSVFLTHLLATCVVFTLLGVYGFSHNAYTAMMVVNAGLPLLYATFKVRQLSVFLVQADKLLFAILLAMSSVLLLVIPGYLLFGNHQPAYISTFGFTISVGFMLVFMLGFGSSVMFELVRKLNEQMTIDPLTKAKNRRFLDQITPQYLSSIERKHTQVSLITCDIDYFKRFNDEYGHDVGDEALRHFVATLQKEVRAQDTVIRMGGEEFLIFCPHLPIRLAFQLAERLRRAVALDEFVHDGKPMLITASFGVSALNNSGDLDRSLKQADMALYQAKSQGRNRVVSALQ